jgi:hypothetical protein
MLVPNGNHPLIVVESEAVVPEEVEKKLPYRLLVCRTKVANRFEVVIEARLGPVVCNV